MASPRPTLTIASIGVSPVPINTTIFKNTQPEYRDNGGDLRPGDRWYDTEDNIEYIFYDQHWVAVTSEPGVKPEPRPLVVVNEDPTATNEGGKISYDPDTDQLTFNEADVYARIPLDLNTLPSVSNQS